MRQFAIALIITAILSGGGADWTIAQQAESPEANSTDQPDTSHEEEVNVSEQKAPDPLGMAKYRRLDERYQVWLDSAQNRVFLGAVVSCREGVLEMFACPAGTKEYESVLAVQSPAYVVHAALLAAGAEPGTTVKYAPEYQAATGPVVDVFVSWSQDGKEHRVRGQQFVQNLQTEQAMKHDWVFCGSGFWKDEETGKQHYHAEGGELICVSNFSTAMMDVTVESSQQNSNLLFGSFTEHIPPLGTQVVIELQPRKTAQAEKPPEDK